MIRRFLNFLPTVLALIALIGCETIDNKRIPASPVHIPFQTISMWEIYGVPGALDSKRFIIEEGQPQNFPYTSMMHTGFGGVLLCGDIHGNAVAYDLSCPVERQRNIRVLVDLEKNNAYCPKCGSVYDVFSNYGVPLSGEAARLGYGLRRYTVREGIQGEYRLISP